MKNNTCGTLIAMVAAAAFAILPATAMADDMSNMNMSGSANPQNNNKGTQNSGANTKTSPKSKKSSSAI